MAQWLSECLPLAQVVIPGSWDLVLHWAPCVEAASPSAYVSVSLCVSHEKINSLKKKLKIKIFSSMVTSADVLQYI